MLQLLQDFGLKNTLWDLDWVDRELNRFLTTPTPRNNSVLINLHANDDAAHVAVRVPGWKPEWFDLSVEGNRLTVAGESQFEDKGEQQARFKRVVNLPFRVDENSVEANYKDGVLNIEIARSEADKPRKISVNAV